MKAEREIEGMLARLTDDGLPSVLPRLRCALVLIERSNAFEGDGDLAAAHLILNDLARDLEETQALEQALLVS